MGDIDVLVVSIDGTIGWAVAARELVASLERAGARVAHAATGPVRQMRTFALTDLVQARAARAAARRGLAELDPKSIVYCSITAALLWPRPGAIWADTIAAENRPGRHGVWQRAVERRRVSDAPLLAGLSAGAFEPLARTAIVVPSPVERSGPLDSERDITALTYTGDPVKRPLEPVLEAWRAARGPAETLVVAGQADLRPEPGIEPTGRLGAAAYRALLRRAKVFVAAPRREDFGIAPLEALADGCVLVTTPAPGPYPARELARQLDPRLVSHDLATALRTALDDPVPGYAERGSELLAPFTHAAVDRTVANELLPRLLAPQ